MLVDSKCCERVTECEDEVKSKMALVQQRMGKYMGTCKVKQTDLQPTEHGQFAMKDTTNICSDVCGNVAELADSLSFDMVTLQTRCEQDKNMEPLFRMAALVNVLDAAWKNCHMSTTTAAAETTTDEPGKGELFEPVDTSTTVFVIDRSGSMKTIACTSDFMYTRYDFAVVELEKAVFRLQETQKFNVIVFDRNPDAMAASPVPATDINKERMLKFTTTHGPRTGFFNLWGHWNRAATNIEKALKLAFAMSGVDAVHLLSDGAATDGAKKAEGMISDDRITPVPVHAVLFMPGVDSTNREKQNLAGVLQELASITNGKYREPFPIMPDVCPVRIGSQMYLDNAGISDVNGLWKQEGTVNGHPRYFKKNKQGLFSQNKDYEIEWSNGDWWLYEDELFDFTRTALYYSERNSNVMPISGWKTARDGTAPPPTVEDYLDHMQRAD